MKGTEHNMDRLIQLAGAVFVAVVVAVALAALVSPAAWSPIGQHQQQLQQLQDDEWRRLADLADDRASVSV